MAAAREVRILGIDPGTLITGFGCLETAAAPEATAASGSTPLAHAAGNVVRGALGGGRVRLVEAGVLRLGGGRRAVEDRLLLLHQQIEQLLERLAVDELALEEAFYGKSVAAALRVGEARGVVLALARRFGVAVYQFAPARIKRAVAGHGQASKDAVAEMVCRELGVAVAPEPRDATDALAAAYCRAQERRVAGVVRGYPRDARAPKSP